MRQRNTQILAHAEHQCTVLVWRAACDGFLQVQAGGRQRAKVEPRQPEGIVGDDSERGVVGTLRQAQQGFADLPRGVELAPSHIKPVQTIQDRDKLWGLAYLLTQRVCLDVGVLHLGRCHAFGHHQCCAESDLQG